MNTSPQKNDTKQLYNFQISCGRRDSAHHIGADKEMIGVCWKEFQMKRLRRPCFRCISWRNPESQTDQERERNAKPEVKGYNAKNELCNGRTRHCITFTQRIQDRRYAEVTNTTATQSITNKIVWPRRSSCVPLGKDIVGYFEPSGWQWRMIITSYLSISPLSSEEGGAVK